jgi:hypothetical protein
MFWGVHGKPGHTLIVSSKDMDRVRSVNTIAMDLKIPRLLRFGLSR